MTGASRSQSVADEGGLIDTSDPECKAVPFLTSRIKPNRRDSEGPRF
jgi:hypothetical protein